MLSDVTFLIGPEKVPIKSHRLILALSSPVFTSMFYSPMLENQDIIEIPDCRPDAFQALIEVSICTHINPKPDNTMLLYCNIFPHLNTSPVIS